MELGSLGSLAFYMGQLDSMGQPSSVEMQATCVLPHKLTLYNK